MTEVARRDVRSITGTRPYVENTLKAHGRSLEQLTPIEPVPGTSWMHTTTVRILPESPTRPIARGRVLPYPPAPRRRPVPRWVLWTLVGVGLVVLVALSCAVAVWAFTPDAPPAATAHAPTPDAHAHTDGAISGLLGMVAVLAVLGLLWRWAFSSGRTFSGTFRGKMD